MPWDESHLHIRSDHRDPSTCEKDSLRTISISEADGIEAVVGKPLGRDYTVTLSFLFAKWRGWTMEKAKEWFKEHEHTAEVPEGYWPPSASGGVDTVDGFSAWYHRKGLAYCFGAHAAGRQFDSMLPTVGDLVGQKFGDWKPSRVSGAVTEQRCPPDSECAKLHTTLDVQCSGLCRFSGASDAAANRNGSGRFDPLKPTVGDLVGQPLGVWRPSKVHGEAAADPSLVFSSYDPMKSTIGDLVGIKNVEAATSSPPSIRRVDGKFDPTQVTVGDLTGLKSVRGHTSRGIIGIEPDDIAVHPRRIRESSR